MVFSVSVTARAGCLSYNRQLAICLIVPRETHEFPASSRCITFALLNHHIHTARVALDGGAGDLLRVQQVIDDHGAVRKFSGVIAFKGLVVRVYVMDSTFGRERAASRRFKTECRDLQTVCLRVEADAIRNRQSSAPERREIRGLRPETAGISCLTRGEWNNEL